MRRIGILSIAVENDVFAQDLLSVFVGPLGEPGWVDGRNIKLIESKFTAPTMADMRAAILAIIHDVGRSSATTRTRFAVSSALQRLPIGSGEARQAVDLFDQENVAGVSVGEEPE